MICLMSWTTTPRGAGSVTSSLLDGRASVSEEGPRTMSQTVSLVRFTLTLPGRSLQVTESPTPLFMTKESGDTAQRPAKVGPIERLLSKGLT